jgi:hypothetical protein
VRWEDREDRSPEPGAVGDQIPGEQHHGEDLEHPGDDGRAEAHGVAGEARGEIPQWAFGLGDLLDQLLGGDVGPEPPVDPCLEVFQVARGRFHEPGQLPDEHGGDRHDKDHGDREQHHEGQ